MIKKKDTNSERGKILRYSYTFLITGLSLFSLITLVCAESTEPLWRNQTTNDTDDIVKRGEIIILKAEGYDETALAYAWLATNESGAWENNTRYNRNDTEEASACYGNFDPNSIETTCDKGFDEDWDTYVENDWRGAFIIENFTLPFFLYGEAGLTFKSAEYNQFYCWDYITSDWSYIYEVPDGTPGAPIFNKAIPSACFLGESTLILNVTFNPGGGTRAYYESNVSWTDVINMSSSSATWTWSNFTWSNSSVEKSTTVAWKIYYNDTSGNENVTDEQTFSIQSNIAPTASNLTEPTDPSTYSSGAVYYFNATICDDDRLGEIDNVLFEWNGTNSTNITTTQSINSTCAIFYTNRTDEPVQNSTIYAFYVNDTYADEGNVSGAFNVSKATPSCSLVGISNHTYGTIDTIICSCTGDGTAHLYRNDTQYDEWNNSARVYENGTYSWVCNTTAGTNYTSTSTSTIQTINLTNTTTGTYTDNSVSTIANTTTTINATTSNTIITLDITTTSNVTNGSIAIVEYNSTPPNTTAAIGLIDLDKFIQINISSGLNSSLSWIRISINYTDAEVTAAGIAENTLKVYYWNETNSDWYYCGQAGWPYCIDSGINTTVNYVWVNISHLSIYGMFGSPPTTTTTTTTIPDGWGYVPTTTTTTTTTSITTTTTIPIICGNGVCDRGENCGNCPEDCPCPSREECVGNTCRPIATPPATPPVPLGAWVMALVPIIGVIIYLVYSIRKRRKQVFTALGYISS